MTLGKMDKEMKQPLIEAEQEQRRPEEMRKRGAAYMERLMEIVGKDGMEDDGI